MHPDRVKINFIDPVQPKCKAFVDSKLVVRRMPPKLAVTGRSGLPFGGLVSMAMTGVRNRSFRQARWPAIQIVAHNVKQRSQPSLQSGFLFFSPKGKFTRPRFLMCLNSPACTMNTGQNKERTQIQNILYWEMVE